MNTTSTGYSDTEKLKHRVIHIDLHKNPIARDHYETDPHKHFSSITKKDFKGYSLAVERKINKRQSTTPASQRELSDKLSQLRRSAGELPNIEQSIFFSSRRIDPPELKMLDDFRNEKFRTMSAKASKSAWHL